jgi:hypothetical protein
LATSRSVTAAAGELAAASSSVSIAFGSIRLRGFHLRLSASRHIAGAA